MSYDYMLAKASTGGDMEAFSESAATHIIGPIQSLKAAINSLFPSVQWRQSTAKRPDGTVGLSWFGLQGPPEFHLMVEANGDVRTITMSHCERTEVERVTRELGLAAFDMQSLEVFGG
jgi:hypothetical protein